MGRECSAKASRRLMIVGVPREWYPCAANDDPMKTQQITAKLWRKVFRRAILVYRLLVVLWLYSRTSCVFVVVGAASAQTTTRTSPCTNNPVEYTLFYCCWGTYIWGSGHQSRQIADSIRQYFTLCTLQIQYHCVAPNTKSRRDVDIDNEAPRQCTRRRQGGRFFAKQTPRQGNRV